MPDTVMPRQVNRHVKADNTRNDTHCIVFLFCQGKGLTMSLFAIRVYNSVMKGAKKCLIWVLIGTMKLNLFVVLIGTR